MPVGTWKRGSGNRLWAKLLGRLYPYEGSYLEPNYQRVLKKQIEKPTGVAEKLNFLHCCLPGRI